MTIWPRRGVRSKRGFPSWEELVGIYKAGNRLAQDYADICKRVLMDQEGSGKRVLLITSAVDGEGKTTTAVNLATLLAREEKKTLLVDANFRRPALAKYLGKGGTEGLVEMLTERSVQKATIMSDRDFPYLDFLPHGNREGGLIEGLLSGDCQSLLSELASPYEFVILDGPSVNVSPESLALGKLADRVLLVVKCDDTPKKEIHVARDSLLKHGIRIEGVILNRVPKYVPSFYRS